MSFPSVFDQHCDSREVHSTKESDYRSAESAVEYAVRAVTVSSESTSQLRHCHETHGACELIPGVSSPHATLFLSFLGKHFLIFPNRLIYLWTHDASNCILASKYNL